MVSVIVLAMLLLGIVSLGWWRRTVFPTVYGWQYKNDVKGITAESYYSLGNPLWFFGVDNINNEPTKCELDGAKGLKLSLICYRAAVSERVITTQEDATRYRRWINTLTRALVSQDWNINEAFSKVNGQPIADANDTNLDTVSDMFLVYEKDVKGLKCRMAVDYSTAWVEVNGVFNPGVKADYICHRTTYYFGKPY